MNEAGHEIGLNCQMGGCVREDGYLLLFLVSSPATYWFSQGLAHSTPALRALSQSGHPATGPHPRMTSCGIVTAWLTPLRAPRIHRTAHYGAEPSLRATSTWNLPAPGAVTRRIFSVPSWTLPASPKRRAPRLPAHLRPTGRSTGSAGHPNTHQMVLGMALPSLLSQCQSTALLRQ